MRKRSMCGLPLRLMALSVAMIPFSRVLAQPAPPDSSIHILPQPVTVAPGLQLLATVSDPGVFKSILGSFNINAADTTNADVIAGSPYNLTGSGLKIGVWEAGGYVSSTHQELIGRVEYGDSDPFAPISNHGTHVAGTIAASGVYPAAKGMAPGVTIRSYTAVLDTSEITNDGGMMALSNHSYGFLRGWTVLDWGIGGERTWVEDRDTQSVEDASFGKYDNYARELDEALHAQPRLLSVWAAGNDRVESGTHYGTFTPAGANTYVTFLSEGGDGPGGNIPGYYRVTTNDFSLPPADGNGGTGYDSLAQAQVAKNSLTVGAIDDLLDEGPGRTGVMTNFSSWGPTDDGRMKPDVVGNGVGVLSSVAFTNNTYASASGTSMSAPNVTGTMALVIQRLMNVRQTNQHPLSATSKGLAIHTAHDLFAAGPDYTSGYGVVDGEAAVNFIDATTAATPTNYIIEGSYVNEKYTETFEASGGQVKATLVWNDPAGPDAFLELDDHTLALVNDLDIWITDELNNIYRPWTLDPANPADPAVRDSRNFRDNVEQVLIDSLLGGTQFTVHIDLSGLLTESQQQWSLLLSGGHLVPEPSGIMLLLLPCAALARRRRT